MGHEVMFDLIRIPRTGSSALTSGLSGIARSFGHEYRLADVPPDREAIVSVRDPVARFRSAWAIKHGRWADAESMAFDLPAAAAELDDFPPVFRPQTWWLGDTATARARCFAILRTERLDDDFAGLCGRLGVERTLPGVGNRNDLIERGLSPVHISRDAEAAVRDFYRDDQAMIEELSR